MTSELKQELLQLARQSIAGHWTRHKPQRPEEPEFLKKRGVFVSLHSQGELRGCIGYIQPYKNIADSVIEMAQAAAFQDPRFTALSEKELDDVDIEISVLSEMTPVLNTSEIKIGRDGLYIKHPRGSGLLLPQVPTEWNWDLKTFLKQICRKAGLHDEAWKDEGAQLYRFEAEVFGDADFLP
ncbi:MAG TPA: AmmeMemoRadiSam system protein A [Candidatus Syntrophosphaera sp.]|jgi:AmmeMemoRadiSam system protein A|nr:AmmeMemoRadiSam system protein A [Candidatus Syntrophosphaera sp.]